MKRNSLMLLLLLAFFTLTACGHTHEFGDWTVAKEATCTEDGEQERRCTSCEETETEIIPAVGHKFSDWETTLEATCTAEGKRVRTCNVCGIEEAETIAATGHSFSPATLFEPKICKKCGLTEGTPLGTVIGIGQEVAQENHKFSVSDVYFASKVSEKRGNVTYNLTEGYYLIIKLSFTNLANEALEKRNSSRFSDMELRYDNKYNYKGEFAVLVGDIVPLDTQYAYVFFSVPNTMSNDDGKPIQAAFAIDGTTYAVIVREGTGNAESETIPADVLLDKDVSAGSMRTDGESFAFTLDKVYFSKKVSEQVGNTTYNSQEGYYLVLQMSFTNLSTDTIDKWHSSILTDIKLVHNDKYTYDGEFRVLTGDIVPLSTKNAYLMFEVPELLNGSEEPLVAMFAVNGRSFTVNCRDVLD